MTNSTALDAFTGGAAHLKLHAPEVPGPFQDPAHKEFGNFDAFNTAFQQVTGWELAWRETAASFQYRSQREHQEGPAIGELVICDLSPLLPPGIPAAGRIYSEKLVEELNHVLAELGNSRRRQFELERSARPGQPDPDNRPVAAPGDDLAVLRTNLPFETANVALTPLYVQESVAALEWFVDASGVVRFALVVCQNGERNSTRELIAARTTFLAECRHQSDNEPLLRAMVDTNDRLFDAEASTVAMAGTLNPLTGDLMLSGDPSFLNASSMATLDVDFGLRGETRMHLPRGQHIAFSYWPGGVEADEVQGWKKQTLDRFRGVQPGRLKSVFQSSLQEAIPSVPAAPRLAVAISRL